MECIGLEKIKDDNPRDTFPFKGLFEVFLKGLSAVAYTRKAIDWL